MKCKIAVLAVAALLIVSVAAYAVDLSAGLSFGNLQPDGKVKSDGDSVDLENDLGIGDDSPVGLFVRVDGEKHHFVLDYAKISFDGSRTIVIPFAFQGVNYAINADIDTKMEFSLLELTYYYDLWETNVAPNSHITLSPLAKFSNYGADLGIDATVGGVPGASESFSESLPIPTIGLICTYEFAEIAKVSGQINMISVSGNTFSEYEFIVGVKPVEQLNLELGYKTTKMDFDESGNMLDFNMGGLFGQVSFIYSF